MEAINRVYLLPFLLLWPSLRPNNKKTVNKKHHFILAHLFEKEFHGQSYSCWHQTDVFCQSLTWCCKFILPWVYSQAIIGINCYIYDNFFPEGKWFWKELSRKFTFGDWQDSDGIRHQSQPLYKGRHFLNLKMKANVPRSSKHPSQPHF